MLDKNKSIVLFSGGQDSSACLVWALNNYKEVQTIGFDYGQRHNVELKCRKALLKKLKSMPSDFTGTLTSDYILNLEEVKSISTSSLLNYQDIEILDNGIPNTFVPGRNLIFLNYAGIIAYQNNIQNIIGGMCETDFSGYPDCRNETIISMENSLSLGMDENFKIKTPLMFKSKADVWEVIKQAGGKKLIDIIVEESHTCYNGNRSNRFSWGYGCNSCPACELRIKGWNIFVENNPEFKI
jgi:7-cyano-7-deazaguanine synthase